MDRNVEALIEQVGGYARRCDRVSVGGRFDGCPSDGAIRLETDGELLEGSAVLAKLRRLVDAELTKRAGEIARRSEPRDDSSLARKTGASGAAHLVAQVTGIPRAQAGTMVASGVAFRPRENAFTGEPLPAQFPQVAAAFADGLLDAEVAAALRRALAKSAPGLAPYEVDDLERQVLEFAAEGWDADALLVYLKKIPEHAHPNGGAPRADEPVPTQSVTRKLPGNGLFRRVDGLRLLAKKALRMDDGQVGGTAVTLLVTMTKDAQLSGLGTAELPDCGSEIPASIARLLAADAEVIPVVLGGKSQPLDLGVGRRFFSEAQRRAMAVRDGGCVGPGCDAPPSWCDGAHIRPAGYGKTSLDNGVLLCWRCHLLHDTQGWQLHRIHDRWWWTPPPWIDPTARKRPGGRIPPIDLTG